MNIEWVVRVGDGETYEGAFSKVEYISAVPVVGDLVLVCSGVYGEVTRRAYLRPTKLWKVFLDTHVVSQPGAVRSVLEKEKGWSWE